MFYTDVTEQRLRFGDVLKGYLSTTPTIIEPFAERNEAYNIDVRLPDFCVVMDPCCQIGGGSISLTPLIQVRSYFWDVPYFFEDITRINRVMSPRLAIHPHKWNELTSQEKMELINATPQHGYLRFFVYEENDAFPPYNVSRDLRYEEKIDRADQLPTYEERREKLEFQTKYYMIDFKSVHHLNCKKISRPDKPLDSKIQNSKILQLSIRTRNELRDKMSFYYGNPPDEDRTDV